MNSLTVKSVLQAVAEVLPEEGEAPVHQVTVREGWGDTVNVRILAPMKRTPANHELATRLRLAVESALRPHRHRVEIAWED